jgi:adenylate cyclase
MSALDSGTQFFPSAARLTRVVIVMLACCLAVFLEWRRPELVNRIDESLRDAFLRLTVDPMPETRITVIDIDEESIAKIGPWPWSRERIADLVEILFASYQARAVGLDIVFPEHGDSAGDARLAALAINAPLTLAQILDYTPRSPSLLLGTLLGGQPISATAIPVSAHGYIANHRGMEGARCVGNIGYAPDSDGILRRIPVLTRFEQKDYPDFAAALVACGQAQGDALGIPMRGNSQGFWRIPYRSAIGAYSVIPAFAILLETAPKELVSGRYILVGSSALGQGDRVSTPLAPLSAGVMVHAASVSALLDLTEGIPVARSTGPYMPLLWLFASTLIAMFFLARLSVWGNLLLVLCLLASWLFIALWGIRSEAEWSISSPLLVFSFFLLAAVHHEWRESRRRALRLIDTFSHYVAQPVLDEILRSGLAYSLKPTLREVTVLIADMEGYTRTTSSLSLEDAAQLTKGFLDCLTRPVLAHAGTLDKYSGDGLVAFWGAPLPCPEQADRAVSAALDILSEVDDFNRERRKQGFLPVRVRIGIESGEALVGDLGTPFRSTYTAVGDCINFASRLEATARDLPTQLVIGSAANAKLKNHSTYSLGIIALRGTETRIEVFSVK